MKNIFTLMSLFLIMTFVSCGKKSDMDSQIDEFTLEKTKVKLVENTSERVNVIANHTDFSLVETEEGRGIAKVTFSTDKKKIEIQGIKVGRTDVKVLNNRTNVSKILHIEVVNVPIQPSDYVIEGTILKSWNNENTTTIDMQSDPVLNSVTEIGRDAFYGKKNITQVILPKSLISIGDSAFGSTSVESIVIPNGVKEINKNAFRECEKLTSIILPEQLEVLYPGSFASSGLQSIVIPGSIKIIPDSTFQHCSNLNSVIIQEGVTTLGVASFANCTSLKEIVLPKSITDILTKAFEQSINLESVAIEAENPPNIGEDIFHSSIKAVYVPKKSLENYQQRADWLPYRSILKDK